MSPDVLAALRLRALAEPNRLRMVSIMAAGPLSQGDLTDRLGTLAQGTVSNHLRVLRLVGLVAFRKDGGRHLYRVKRPAFTATAELLRRYTK